MANQETVKKRLNIIGKVMSETGLSKKRKIMSYIRNNDEYKEHFAGLSDTRFREIITFDSSEDVVDFGHKITGRSVYKNAKGEKISEWVKTTVDREFQKLAMDSALKALKETIVPYEPTPYVESTLPINSKLCNQYTLTDFHLGMLAWGEESGDDWNMEIAEDLLVRWFEHAIENSPNAGTAVFAQIGDFLHWDGLTAVTPASKHVLDADTRYTKLVRVAIRVTRRIINMLLLKYCKVHVILAEGNHDEASSVWLREVFNMFYENDHRVVIDTNPDPYYNFMFGNTCLFYHHGHKKNIKGVDSAFVGKFKENYGKSKNVYGHIGHFHHTHMIESNLMIVEQHRTLAAKDAYASRGGYLSGRDAKVITYHKEHGEVGRQTISSNMLK